MTRNPKTKEKRRIVRNLFRAASFTWIATSWNRIEGDKGNVKQRHQCRLCLYVQGKFLQYDLKNCKFLGESCDGSAKMLRTAWPDRLPGVEFPGSTTQTRWTMKLRKLNNLPIWKLEVVQRSRSIDGKAAYLQSQHRRGCCMLVWHLRTWRESLRYLFRL
jgi:hypothetical protein